MYAHTSLVHSGVQVMTDGVNVGLVKRMLPLATYGYYRSTYMSSPNQMWDDLLMES